MASSGRFQLCSQRHPQGVIAQGFAVSAQPNGAQTLPIAVPLSRHQWNPPCATLRQPDHFRLICDHTFSSRLTGVETIAGDRQ